MLKSKKKQSGQSILEFAFMVPIITSMLVLLMQVENAITTSVVNQKYARSTMNFLMFNQRYYMELNFVYNQKSATYMSRYWVGVDDKIDFGGGTTVSPSAPIREIGRTPGDDTPQSEYSPSGDGITTRQKVRVRSTVFTCLPPFGAKGQTLLSEGNLSESVFAGSYHYCTD